MTNLLSRFMIGLVWLLALLPAQAQDELALGAPLLALNTVEQEAILLVDVTTNTLRELRAGDGAHHVWDFSPDGCRLLFTLADGRTPAKLYSMALDGGDVQVMVEYAGLPAAQWGVWDADWSVTGAIAFTLQRQQTINGIASLTHHLAVISADDPTPQIYSVSGSEFSPRWSPAGDWLAYISFEERVAGATVFATAIPTAEPPSGQTPPAPTLLNEADLWIVSADGGTKYRLTNLPTGSVTQPRWSPDGELVSFVYAVQNSSDMLWMIANRPAALPTQLSYQWAMVLDHTWLPDGTALLGALREFNDVRENRLWQVPLVTVDDRLATRYLSENDLAHADYPRFSADGRYLALRAAYDLWLIDTETGSQQRLTVRATGNTPPVWSPAAFSGEADC